MNLGTRRLREATEDLEFRDYQLSILGFEK
jgi:hypothetical protein